MHLTINTKQRELPLSDRRPSRWQRAESARRFAPTAATGPLADTQQCCCQPTALPNPAVACPLKTQEGPLRSRTLYVVRILIPLYNPLMLIAYSAMREIKGNAEVVLTASRISVLEGNKCYGVTFLWWWL
jgi:hypothetical protein